jgi:hypothetical protein
MVGVLSCEEEDSRMSYLFVTTRMGGVNTLYEKNIGGGDIMGKEIEKCIDRMPHDFQPRFDERFPGGQLPRVGTAPDAESLVKAMNSMKEKIYIGDVCVRCGKTVKPQGGVT